MQRGEEEGEIEGADTMATQAVTATALMGEEKEEGSLSLSLLKRQEPLHKLMTCVILLVIREPLASFI